MRYCRRSLLMSALLTFSFSIHSQAASDCKRIRFSDVGWTDITATTALASVILESLGYEVKTVQVSVPVTFVSLKNRDLDVFLGNWMPSMAADIKPYQADGTVETIGTLLKGARYTVAVPKFVYDAGVTSVADLKLHKDKFQGKIYGIEPGNDGNRQLQKMIGDNAFSLKGWKLIESSEQAMLMEVKQAIKQKKWIAFLGWEPHPMNQKFQLAYLSGADGYFGPNLGSSTVSINTRRNYSKECPEVAHFLRNYSMTVESENTLMEWILDQGMEPKAAAKRWIQENPKKVESWLAGVHSLDGRNAYSVIESTFVKGTLAGKK